MNISRLKIGTLYTKESILDFLNFLQNLEELSISFQRTYTYLQSTLLVPNKPVGEGAKEAVCAKWNIRRYIDKTASYTY